MTAREEKFKAAREAAGAASRAYTEVAKAYRARAIGDAEFLAGRKALNESVAAYDAAEAEYLATEPQAQLFPEPDPQINLFGGKS